MIGFRCPSFAFQAAVGRQVSGFRRDEAASAAQARVRISFAGGLLQPVDCRDG
jgi:hypothetical protein